MQEGETGMMDIFQLAGTIAINADSAHKAISTITRQAENSSVTIKNAFNKIGSAAIACGKVVASGLAVGTAAMGALLKSSIGEFAEYEQLVGGVETLFKESKGKVMAYANEAYKTAGLSANEYMSTVTSFSASLLQGLNGDTEKAAELANMAITDMSDNANKMGTDMTLIQNAYQGFAKQNYTMLDNLKLGYGGTQAEMARLINDSGVLGDAITITAETVNQVPFHKIIEAIHVVQTEMDITGTTAKEASTTISGSFSSFKSAWKNLLIGLADENADIGTLFGNMVNAGEIVLQNVTAVLPTIKENLKTALIELAAYIDTEMENVVWPNIQDIFRNAFGIELADWETFKTDVSVWWTEDVKPILDKITVFYNSVVNAFSSWLKDEDTQNALTVFSDALKGIAGVVLDNLITSFDWLAKNSEWISIGLGAIATSLAAGAIAAHPYATAVWAVANALMWLWKNTEEAPINSFSAYTEDEIAVLQQFHDACKAAQKAREEYNNADDVFEKAALFDAKALAEANESEALARVNAQTNGQEMLRTYYDWIGENEDAFSLDIPIGVEEGAESTIQGELNGMSFEAFVKMHADTTALPSELYSIAAGNLGKVSWNAEGAIFNKPTIFNTPLGLQGVGEAGAEAVAPIAKLQQYVADAVQRTVGGMQFNIVLDSGTLVGQLAPQMDARLGTIGGRKGRGN